MQDGFSQSDIDAYWSKVGASAAPATSAAPAPAAPAAPAVVDEKYAKYERMRKMLPEGPIRQKMMQDGLSQADIDAYWKIVGGPPAAPAPPPSSGGAASTGNSAYEKYDKMRKMLPEPPIRQKMMQDGIPQGEIDAYWNWVNNGGPVPVPGAAAPAVEAAPKGDLMAEIRAKKALKAATPVDSSGAARSLSHAAPAATPVSAAPKKPMTPMEEMAAKLAAKKAAASSGVPVEPKMTARGAAPVEVKRKPMNPMEEMKAKLEEKKRKAAEDAAAGK
jgi:hypothetical protein